MSHTIGHSQCEPLEIKQSDDPVFYAIRQISRSDNQRDQEDLFNFRVNHSTIKKIFLFNYFNSRENHLLMFP
ncbi:hypothetical Protein YC6258_01937 [Gynuella sunshinyii YC6258]|uniref:Uncharacterized protein n=1 Tax=Gynuella sunshinyii YC6258 TaxID=1445510 RepID=A0A0C5VI85_9GAMM|nr:hypothetical Protein YC6258_01937 [Gynuella sunshinyii YC6258]